MVTSETDKLVPPKFLRRGKLTPEKKAAAARLAAEINGHHINWAPFRSEESYREERRQKAMAKIGVFVANSAAPVEVHYRDFQGKVQLFQRFDNLEQFEAWHKSAYNCSCTLANQDVTILLAHFPPWFMKTIKDGRPAAGRRPLDATPVAKKVSARPDIAARGPVAPRAPGAPRRYIDARHVRRLEAAGFGMVPGSQPIMFQRGKVSITFAPPVTGAWSSTWTLGDGRTGKGMTPLFQALEGK